MTSNDASPPRASPLHEPLVQRPARSSSRIRSRVREARGIGPRRAQSARRGQQQIEEPLLGGYPALSRLRPRARAHHLDGQFDKVPDHRLNVAAYVATSGNFDAST